MNFEVNQKVFDKFPELESERLKYCQIKLEDSETLFEIRTNEEVMRFMGVEKMKSISESKDLIESVSESFKAGSGISWGIIEKSSNIFIGYFGFWRIDSKNCRGEIGYALHPDYWNKGYMKETAMKSIEYGFGKMNLHSIEANVSPDNLPSIKLLEKIGFKKEAHFRENVLFNKEFKDSVIYSLLEKDFIKK
jgi:ribosomal-protein-alanine N-acetyltransferase